jgi:TolB protein
MPLWLGIGTALSLLIAACGGGTEQPPGTAPDQGTSPELAIVYAGSAGEGSELFGFNLPDGARHQLTSLSREVGFPVWSPSGDRIAFLVMGEETANLMVMDTESGEVSVLIADNGNPADWGPDGKRLLIAKDAGEGGRGLFIVDVRSGAEERVETGSSQDAYARWSRTGDAITYESGRDGNPEIYWTNLETGETARLTENPELDEWPSLSRDGGHIAWASGNEEEKDLWVMRADGSEKRRLTEGMLFGDAFPEWSPDGSQILLTVRESDEFVLKLVDVASGEVTHLGEGAAASWR